MPKTDYDFTFKFFRPPQRTVPFRNGLLDTRTKHTIAQDRLIVAEQRILDAERRKSASNLQLIAFEQKQLEKRLATIYSKYNTTVTGRPLKMRGRSTSEVIFRSLHQTTPWTELFPLHHSNFSVSLNNSNQNLLSLPKIDDIQQRRFSAYSDGDVTENPYFNLDTSSGEEAEISKSNPQLPSIRKTTIKKKIFSPKISKQQTNPLPPIVAIIPPDDEILFLRR